MARTTRLAAWKCRLKEDDVDIARHFGGKMTQKHLKFGFQKELLGQIENFTQFFNGKRKTKCFNITPV
jgi:hypothetical protein